MNAFETLSKFYPDLDLNRFLNDFPLDHYEIQESYSVDNWPFVDINARIYQVNSYRSNIVQLTLDFSDYTFVKEFCNCNWPNSPRENDTCEHTILLTYHFLKLVESKEAILPIDVKRYSSTVVKELLVYANNHDDYTLADVSHSIEIYPVLKVENSHSLNVQFRIGRINDTHYIVKNIFQLVESIENNKYISYGKKLDFVAGFDSFTEESLPYIKFMQDCIKNNNSYEQQSYYSYEKISYIQKEFHLSGIYLDRFMSILKDHYYVIDSYSLTPKVEGYGLIDQDFKGNASISQQDNGAFTLQGEFPHLMYGADYDYYIDHDINRICRSKKLCDDEHEFVELFGKPANQLQYIAQNDLPNFLQNVLPHIEKVANVNHVNYVPDLLLPEKPTFDLYLDLPHENTISATLYANYTFGVFNLTDTNEKSDHRRNSLEEKKMVHMLEVQTNAIDSSYTKLLISDEEDGELIYKFLTYGVQSLSEYANIFISDRLKRINVRPANTPNIGVSVSNGLLNLELQGNEKSFQELAEILLQYKPKKKFYRLKSGEFLTIQNEEIEELKQLQTRMDLTDSDLLYGSIELPKYRAFALEDESNNANYLTFDRDEQFKQLITNIKDPNKHSYKLPKHLEGILRNYQKDGFHWLASLKENGFAALLADEMGLGKTIQVISLIASDPIKKRCLIVCPASLVYNWKSEFETFAPNLNATMVVGLAKEREAIIQESKEDTIFITSYDALKRDVKLYKAYDYNIQVIDEAQYIKNASTQAAKSVKQIPADFRIALTGTPIENKLSELWSIFDYLMPGYLYTYRMFKNRFEKPIVNDKNNEVNKQLHNMITPFILRRLKRNVLKDLPEKIEEVFYSPMESKQLSLYQAHVDRLKLFLANQTDEDYNKQSIYILSELTKLRQLCCSPHLLYSDYDGNSSKEDVCMELIENAISEGHKILLFSQFTSMFDLLIEKLNQKHIAFYKLTGKTPKKERNDLVNDFNNNDIPLFLISLKAGGTGLNLTSADIVIHYDPWWNTATQNQATDRAHRIGQVNVVTVYQLIMKNSIEEKILKLQKEKKALADEILSGDEIANTKLTKEQLLNILG